jgi:hypothetical protein
MADLPIIPRSGIAYQLNGLNVDPHYLFAIEAFHGKGDFCQKRCAES